MRNLFARFRRAPVDINLDLHVDDVMLDPEVLAYIRALTEPREPTVDEVRDQWANLYAEQTALLDSVTTALEAQTAIVNQARSFMTIMAQRCQGGHPLFLINDNAAPGEADTLRHAILSLQALLEGTEMPACITLDVVKH